MPENVNYTDLLFPLHGVDLSREFQEQEDGTTPLGENVRTFEALTRRGRGGSRSGHAKFVNETVSGLHEIQELQVVTRIAGDGSALGFNAVDLPDASLPPFPIGWPLLNFGFFPILGEGGFQPGATTDPGIPHQFAILIWFPVEFQAAFPTPGSGLVGADIECTALNGHSISWPLGGSFGGGPPPETAQCVGIFIASDPTIRMDYPNYLAFGECPMTGFVRQADVPRSYFLTGGNTNIVSLNFILGGIAVAATVNYRVWELLWDGANWQTYSMLTDTVKIYSTPDYGPLSWLAPVGSIIPPPGTDSFEFYIGTFP